MSGQDLQLRLIINADGSAAVSVVKQTAGAVGELARAQDRAAAATKGGANAGQSYIEALKRELAQLQLSTGEFRAREAAMRGATAEQITQVRRIGAAIDQINGQAQQLAQTASGIPGFLATWIAPVALLATIRAMVGALTEARLQVEKLNATQLFANNGDLAAAGRDIDFVKERAQTLGLEFVTVANSWGKFNAAAKGSVLAGDGAREVFDSILKASSVLRLSQQETEGALLAVQQMMSKGNVQAEELRGQLGERLPGAFSIAARAMGVTERELNKMLETGQVLATDFLPKFAAELTRTLGDEPQRASMGTQAALNRLSNAWVDLKQEVAQMGGPDTAIKALTSGFVAMGDAVKNARGEITKNNLELDAHLKLGLTIVEMWKRVRAGSKESQNAALTAEIAQLAQQSAGASTPWLKARIDKEIEEITAQLRKLNEVDTAIAMAEKDTLQRRAANKAATEALIEQSKASDDRWLKARAENGDKAAKLAVAYKEIDDKFARDLASNVRSLDYIASLKQQAYKKIYGGDGKAAAQAIYAETIAREEALQKAITESVKRGTDALKASRESGAISETRYYLQLDTLRAEAIAKEEASVAKQLAIARAGGQAKLADVQKYQGELAALDQERVDQAKQTEANIAKIQRAAMIAEVAARTKHNEVILGLLENLATMREQQAAELEDKRFELSLLGQSEEQQRRLQAMRQVELAERRALTQAYKEYLKAIDNADTIKQEVELTNIYNAKQVAIRANAAAQRDVTTTIIDQSQRLNEQKTFWDGFFQSIKGGWKGVRDYVKNFFFDWLIKQLSQQFTVNVGVNASGGAGGIGGLLSSIFGGSGGAGGGGGIGGLIGNLFGAGGAGGIGGLIGSALGIGTGGGLLGMMGLGGFGAGLGGAASLAGSTALSFGVAGASTGAMFASFIPFIGPLIAIAATLLPSLLKSKDGLWFDFGAEQVARGRNPNQVFQTALAPVKIGGEGNLEAVKPFVAQFQNLSQNFVNIFGKEVADKARTALGNWTGFSGRGRGTEYTNEAELTRALQIESKDVMAEYFSRVFSVVNQKIADTISAWEGTTEELVKYIQDVLAVSASLQSQAPMLKAIIGETISLDQLVALQKEGEALTATLSRVVGTFALTSEIAALMGKGADAFGAIGLESLEARERLVSLAGGLQALSTGVSFYLDKFFTDAERGEMLRKKAQAELESGFGALGIAIPQNRQQFRALVDSIDLSTQSGQALFVALMNLAPALDVILDKTEDFVATIDRVQDRYARNSVGGDPIEQPPALSASQDYLTRFFTDAERQARRLADARALVVQSFSAIDVAVPRTRAEFIALAESCDLNTVRGRQVYAMLMQVAAAFADVTEAASENIQIMDRSARSMGEGRNTPAEATEAYLEGFFTSAERQALALAATTREVNDGFAALGIAVPTSRAAFRTLVEGIDRSTEAGRLLYNSLMALVPGFTAMTTAVVEAVGIAMQAADLLNIGGTRADASIRAMFAIIDSTADSLDVKLSRKLAIVSAMTDQLFADYEASVAANGGVAQAQQLAILFSAQAMQAQQTSLANDIALLASLNAQYGSQGAAMFELERWKQEQLRLAGNNAAAILVIEQSYQTRRNAILTGGVAAGLNAMSATLQDWLNGLMLNQNLSVLTPQQRLAEARAQYERALTGNDAGAITSAADAYLSEARSFYASGDAYSAIFAAVVVAVTGRANAPASITGTPTAGSGAPVAVSPATASATAAQSAATTAVAAANATVDAVNATKLLLAQIIAETRTTVSAEAQATRANDVTNTDRVVAAVADRGNIRVL